MEFNAEKLIYISILYQLSLICWVLCFVWWKFSKKKIKVTFLWKILSVRC